MEEVQAILDCLTVTIDARFGPKLLETSIGTQLLELFRLENAQNRFEAIRRGLVAEIAALKRLRNRNESPISQLPPWIFVDILSLSLKDSNWELSDVHNLAQVSKYWADTVLNTSRLWLMINPTQSTKVVSTILKRSGNRPIVVRCVRGADEPTRLEFMKLAATHADRWEALRFQGVFGEDIWALLETPAPHMTELFLYQQSGTPYRPFRLSDGKPLRHLDVEGVTLPWGSNRISGLLSLQIQGINDFPSSTRLHEILSSSPHVFWVLMVDLTESLPLDAQPEAGEGSPSNTFPPMNLPDLHTLVLQKLPKRVPDLLLSTIQSPSLTCVMLDRIDPSHFRPGSNFLQLLNCSWRKTGHLHLRYDESVDLCTLTSVEPSEPSVTDQWVHWAERKPGFKVSVKVAGVAEFWNDLGELMSTTASTMGGCFYLDAPSSEPEPSSEATFPFRVLEHFPRVVFIQCMQTAAINPLMRYLGTPRPDESTGVLTWPCPVLKGLYLGPWHLNEDALTETILTFLRQRYPGRESMLQAAAEAVTEPSTPGMTATQLPAPSVEAQVDAPLSSEDSVARQSSADPTEPTGLSPPAEPALVDALTPVATSLPSPNPPDPSPSSPASLGRFVVADAMIERLRSEPLLQGIAIEGPPSPS